MSADDIRTMIADYMEKGFLENIIDMFRHDASLYPLVGELMTDARMRVRLGISALIETLSKTDPDAVSGAVPGISALLKNENATIRGDAAYLLGIIGQAGSVPLLREVLDDENSSVREIAKEAIEEIEKSNAR